MTTLVVLFIYTLYFWPIHLMLSTLGKNFSKRHIVLLVFFGVFFFLSFFFFFFFLLESEFLFCNFPFFFFVVVNFPRKQDLTFHAICLQWRQFA